MPLPHTPLLRPGGRIALALALAGVIAAAGCGGGTTNPTSAFDPLITAGWDAFVHAYYDVALARFLDAARIQPNDALASTGAGWSLMRLERGPEAEAAFAAGAASAGAPADLFAGWAFLRAAASDHDGAMELARGVLDAEPDWVFIGGSGINAADLHWLIASESYIAGDFATSLAEVRLFEPALFVDIGTATGRMTLAAEIERLRDAELPVARR